MSRGTKGNGQGSPSVAVSKLSTRTAVRSSANDASAEHRRKLEALFAGGTGSSAASLMSSTEMRGEPKVFASPRKSLGRSPSEYRLRLETLRNAREPDDIKKAADNFLSFHQLPDDVDILFKVLQHPSEKVVRDALGQISALLMQGRIAATLLLEERLKEIEARATEPATQSYIEGLRAQLARLKK